KLNQNGTTPRAVCFYGGPERRFGDIGILDSIGSDLYDVVFTLYEAGRQPTLSNILDEVFSRGTGMLDKAANKRMEELEGIAGEREMTDSEYEELTALRKLNPHSDLQWTCRTYARTCVRYKNNREIYQRYLQEGIKEFDFLTGYTPK
ncbi:MAG: hypothetical protein K2O18_04790, partial [Oscillospiraceae bacterium]|nr:hypothetical protein [Oscillospiraceae bacterium]